MKTVYAKHLPYDDGHLGPVLDEMQLCGPPTLRCVKVSDTVWVALEGSHRLAACAELGIEPKLVVMQYDVSDYAPGRWGKILTMLPYYQFDSVMILNIEDFKWPSQMKT